MFRHVFLLLMAFMALTQAARAQFSDSIRHQAAFSSTGVLNRTNDRRSYLFNNNIRLRMRRPRTDANLFAGWIYGAQQQRLTNNDFNTVADWNLRSRLPRFYYWSLGSFETSYSLNVINRVQAGSGLAYNILDRGDSLSLNISNGILYEQSRLRLGDTAQSHYSTARNSLRLRLRYRLKQYLNVESTAFLQNSLSDDTDYIIRSNTTISLKLQKWLALTTALTYNKVTRTRSENLLLTFGLTVERWF